MAGRETGNTFGQHRVTRAAKAGVGLVAVAALGYVMLVVVEHAGPLLNDASGFALESRMVNTEPVTGLQDAAMSTGTATAAARPTETAPARDFDYFPDHYRNQAKEPAEPIDTF